MWSFERVFFHATSKNLNVHHNTNSLIVMLATFSSLKMSWKDIHLFAGSKFVL